MNYQKRTPNFFRYATSMFRKKPSFIIVGASRCGTTTVFDYLISNQSCASPLTKEIGFFHNPKSILLYNAYFPIKTKKITGEASPNYFIDSIVPKNIKKFLPNVKILILIRNPVERAFSHYSMNISSNLETENFEKSLELEENRIVDKVNRFIFSYKTTGHYIEHILNWKKYFDDKQLLVINYDDINLINTKKKMCSFINIPFENNQLKKLSLVPKNKIPSEVEQSLYEYFKPYNEKLFDYLGKDLGWTK